MVGITITDRREPVRARRLGAGRAAYEKAKAAVNDYAFRLMGTPDVDVWGLC